MNLAIKSLLFASLLIGVNTSYGLIERRTTQVFDVPQDAVFVLNSSAGSVDVREVPDSKVIEVVVIKSAEVEKEAEMDRRLEGIDLQMRQTATGAVEVSMRARRVVAWSWKKWIPVNVSYEVRVPSRCDLNIYTGQGSITVGSLKGDLRLINDSGTIFTQEIDGSVVARSRIGDIAITACTGAIDASTERSNITVGRTGSRTTLSSKGGYIEVQRSYGNLVIRGDNSDIQAGFVSPLRGSSEIVTSGGSVELQVDNNVSGELDLRASVFGQVKQRGTLPMEVAEGGVGKSNLAGTVNSGGEGRIMARANGGHIILRSMEPLLMDGGVRVANQPVESR